MFGGSDQLSQPRGVAVDAEGNVYVGDRGHHRVAVFDKDGRSVAFVLKGSTFEERTVQVARRGKSELLIASGLQPGEKVALKDPFQEQPRQ